MLFNSLIFIAFLLIVLMLYYSSRHRRQNVLLLVSSYVFYGWWDYRFLALLFLSTTVDYFCAKRIFATKRTPARRAFLTLSVLTNLGCLGFFKYFDFFSDSAVRLLGMLGMQADLPTLRIILPVGISFYTFQSLSYTIDVYRNRCRPAKSFLGVALYVAFFPQLVAGPIERATNLLPQVESKRRYSADRTIDGIWLILLGYLKKLVIADRCSHLVNAAFGGVCLPFEGAHSWLFLYAFAFQIYGDFSGYSDIARGVAKLLGFDLMENFHKPYLVSNPSAFWRNWHISLSTWLRDYLYIPLGGSRAGKILTFRNVLITMLLGGLWHGAGWAYLFWGLYHGLLLIVHRLLDPIIKPIGTFLGRWRLSGTLWRLLVVLIFFHITCMGWLIFRAGAAPHDVSQTELISNSLHVLFLPPRLREALPIATVVLFVGSLALFAQWKQEAMERFHQWQTRWQVAAVVVSLMLITSLGVFDGAEFIYFQF